MEIIRIEVTGDAKQIDSTVAQLEKVGQVDKKNADQFRRHHEEAKKHHHETIDFNTKLTRSFHELGEGIIAAFAVERIIEFGAESVKAFSELTEQTSRLHFAITAVNGESEESFKRLNEQAETLSKNLNHLYSVKGIMGAQTQLANFGLSGRMIEQLTPQILDIAAATGKTLPEATEKAILAINGQTKGLRDIGVAFKDTGSKTENFNKLLEQTAKFSGAAEEKGHTLSGRLESMKVRWEEAKEQVGEFLARGFDVIDFLTMASDGTEDWNISLKDLAKQLGLTSEQLEKMYSTLGSTVLASQLAIAKANGDGLATNKIIQDLLIVREKEFADRIGKLKDEELEKELKKEKDFAKRTAEGKLFEIIKEGELSHKKKVELLEDSIKSRQKIDNDATLKGEADAEAARQRELKRLEQYYKDLEAIHKKDVEDNSKFNIELIQNETEKKLAQQEAAFEKEQYEFKEREKKLSEIIQKGKQDQRIKARIELDLLFKDEELAAQAHAKKMADIQKEADKKAREEKMKAEIEANEIRYKNGEIENKRALVNGKKSKEAYDKQQKELEIAQLEEKLAIEKKYGVEDIKLQQEIALKKLELQEQSKNATKQLLEGIRKITIEIFSSLEEHVNASIEALNTQMEHTDKMIDVQKALAAKGLANELAFEEKRADELMKKKLAEQKKLMRVKELETFLNSLAKFAEDNPKTALAKALGILAATKAAEAVFMEDGGIAGSANVKTQIGLSGFARRHKGGRDVLAQLDPREGIIPANTMAQWGLHTPEQFRNFLKTPFSEKLISGKNMMVSNNNSDLLVEIKELKDVIKSRPVTSWDMDKLGNLIETRIKEGIRTVTTHKRNHL